MKGYTPSQEEIMSYKILIKRIVPADKADDLMPLLIKLRSLANKHPAYISGETLKRVDNPGEQLVISTWQTLKGWRDWVSSQERTKIQERIDRLLGEKTRYEIYTY
jgi:antibiotic biosynthesis monooxygenase (ABM) superfamily enzyme